ncbi:hypothetical protein [Aestuariivivens sediminis]|uniref:hypothetical protein n=1 Tax=Aestuariivivens sediminis TaxID=2913557 RepID=UPI001F596853|nr:hypothetical protein [Aestuariivivens sediminis]
MNRLLLSLLIAIYATSCNYETKDFEIGKYHVGHLTDSTQVKDLKMIFSNDSISHFDSDNALSSNIKAIEIFDKQGNKLLVLSPRIFSDSTSVISNVQIMDSRYKTKENISTLSTFKDIADAYKITRINNLINSIVVSVNTINAAFTIDKKELPANLRFDRKLNIEATHIPDNAKIKYFFVNWNNK